MQKVFLIDDDTITHFIFDNLLEDEGIEFKAYHSAQEFLNDHTEVKNYTLLIDVHMPITSGLDLLKAMTQKYDLSQTNFIVFTSNERVKSDFLSVNSEIQFSEKQDVNLEMIKALQHGN